MKKKTVECASVPVRVTEDTARYLDDITKDLPKTDQYKFRRKDAVAATEVTPAERTDVSRVTTKAMDRDNEIVLPEGLELEQYRLNPVVLWGHDQDRPIGKALWVKLDAEGVLAKTQYISRPEKYVGEWLPDFVFSMIQADVLRGKSIGFLPLEIRDPEQEELALNPSLQMVISRSLLLEYSVVSVPSNPLAVVEAVSKGVGLDHWQWKVVGQSKKAAPKKARPKLYGPMSALLDAVKLDQAHVEKLAIEHLLKRWEV
jgi:phage head maturation protease